METDLCTYIPRLEFLELAQFVELLADLSVNHEDFQFELYR